MFYNDEIFCIYQIIYLNFTIIANTCFGKNTL